MERIIIGQWSSRSTFPRAGGVFNAPEPDGKEGENCLMWREAGGGYTGPVKNPWWPSWADHDCSDEGGYVKGSVCRLATTKSNFGKIAKLVHQSREQQVEMSEIWRVVLDQRWTAATLNNTKGSDHCYNTVEEDVVIEKIRTELKIEDTNTTNNVDPDKYLQETLETFSLLYFCPPQRLVEAVKLGIFYKNLIENESPRTLVMATMNNISPNNSNKFDNKNLLHELFTELDKEYNFQLGPALIALSPSSQLDQLAELDLPYLKDYKDLISKCVGLHDCSGLLNVSTNLAAAGSGKIQL